MRGLDRLEQDAARLGLRLPPDGLDRVRAFALLLEERAVPLGLVSRADHSRLYDRHILDSLASAALLSPDDRRAYDLGSGAGLPGVVLAAAAPWCRFVLVEPRRRRAGFLELAVERLGLSNVEVAVGRVEDLADGADLATARAFAPLPRAWTAAAPLLRRGGRLVYFAGPSVDPAAVRSPDWDPPAEVRLRTVLAPSATFVIMVRR